MNRCKFCNKALARKADICENCYNTLMEKEMDLEDKKVILEFGSKYDFKYEFSKQIGVNILSVILLISVCVYSIKENVLSGILLTALLLLSTFAYIYIKAQRINSRRIKLYKRKLIYERKWHIQNKIIAKYEDIAEIRFDDLDKDINIFSSTPWRDRIDRKYNMSNIYFRPVDSESLINRGFSIGPVHNFKQDILPTLMSLTGFKNMEEEKEGEEENKKVSRRDITRAKYNKNEKNKK